MRLLTFEELRQKKGHPYCRDHTRRLVKAGLFPKPIDVGPGRIAWSESEVDQHYEELAAKRDQQPALPPMRNVTKPQTTGLPREIYRTRPSP